MNSHSVRSPHTFPLAGTLLLGVVAMCCAQSPGSAGRAVYVERFPKGYALIRYSGSFAREFSTTVDRKAEDVVVLVDGASRPVYALRPSTGEMIEFYKGVRHLNRDLIFAIPLGPYPTRVYEGPFHPEDGFPNRVTNVRDVPGVDAYLKPSARQKALWMEELPNLVELKLQR